MVESLVCHLSIWKPFKSLAMINKALYVSEASAAGTKTTTLESEGWIDDEPPGESTTKSVELDKSTTVETTATDEASRETLSEEALTTADCHTWTEQELVEVPMLTRCTKVEGELIPLEKCTFGLKRNFTIRSGIDICGKTSSMMSSIPKSKVHITSDCICLERGISLSKSWTALQKCRFD